MKKERTADPFLHHDMTRFLEREEDEARTVPLE
jgi:hypothetical protein